MLLSGSFSNLFFWSKVGNGGRVRAKEMRAEGWDAMGYASAYLSQSIHI